MPRSRRMHGTMRLRWFGAAGVAAAIALTTGGGATARDSCMRAPGAPSPYAFSGGRLTAHVGTVVYALEAEPPTATWLATPIPSAWPWLAPTSSDTRVLSRVRLCTNDYPTHGYAIRIYAFRAMRAGTAT